MSDDTSRSPSQSDELFTALGRYVKGWSQQEMLIRAFYAARLGIGLEMAYLLSASTPVSKLIEDCKIITSQNLKEPGLSAALAWLTAANRASDDRNRLLHGAWVERWTGTEVQSILFSTRKKKGELVVSYDAVDVSTIQDLAVQVNAAMAAFEAMPEDLRQLQFPQDPKSPQ